MKRRKIVALMIVCGLAANASFAKKKADPAVEAAKAVAAAEQVVSDAQTAIVNSKALIDGISHDAALLAEVKQMLKDASEDWAVAVAALEQAKKNAASIPSAKDKEMADDYARLAKVNSGIAISGAKVVSTGLYFVEAAAAGKTQSLDVIRGALSAAQASAEQVRASSERTIGLIEAKYSN